MAEHNDHGFMATKENAAPLKQATIDRALAMNEKSGKKALLGYAKSRFSIHCECYAYRGNYQGDGVGPGMPLHCLNREQLAVRLKEWKTTTGDDS
ncbi:unnamed protein product [Pelagomonas calceolata]|uniref:Uncharacterized protein n=2 Tax=Pelagomonas calceolata TaxID=35677 RepID=A0A8J2WWR1_9STRA|nr:unnamed protein product [Pelagomonas calceolata]